jgi:hypothetical protein
MRTIILLMRVATAVFIAPAIVAADVMLEARRERSGSKPPTG